MLVARRDTSSFHRGFRLLITWLLNYKFKTTMTGKDVFTAIRDSIVLQFLLLRLRRGLGINLEKILTC